MPIFPPRIKSTKKIEELQNRSVEVFQAIKHKYPEQKLIKAIEKFRKAKLSLLKAKIHEAQSNFYKKQLSNPKIEELKELTAKIYQELEEEISIWQSKSHEEIIDGIRKKYGI